MLQNFASISCHNGLMFKLECIDLAQDLFLLTEIEIKDCKTKIEESEDF
jgi:hypothetical protein